MASEAFEAEVNLFFFALVFKGYFIRETVLVILVANTNHNHQNSLHSSNLKSEEIEFILEDTKNMTHDFLEVSFALGNELATLFNIRSHLWEYKFRINFTIPFYQCMTKGGWY